jgi:O-antigen/teichoic acid export membrane protein
VGVVPLLVVFIVFARDVADILGGPSFLDAGPLLQLLMIGVGASFLGSVFVEPIVALGHQKWMLWMTLVLLTANVIANVLLIPPYGATGAAVAFLGTEILALVITASLYSRLAALPRPTRLPRIAAAAAAMGLVTLLKVTPVGDLLGDVGSVLVLGSLGSLVYLVGLYAFGGMPPSLHDTLGAPVLARLRALTPARGRA